MSEPYYFKYLRLVPESSDPVKLLRAQFDSFYPWLLSISEGATLQSQDPYTWTFRQVLNHLSDCERVFAFRALWMARGETESLASFDENRFSLQADPNAISWNDLVDEFAHVRASTISLFELMPQQAWERVGVAAGFTMDVRTLCSITFGHVAHHEQILRKRWELSEA